MLHWKQAEYHEPQEFRDPDVEDSGYFLDGTHFLRLEKLRKDTGWPMLFNWSVGGCVDVHGSHGHSDKSYHLLISGCKATDFYFDIDKSAREQYNEICRLGFGGIGFYPWWKHPGWHVDSRPIELTQHWISPERGKYIYFFN